MPERDQARRNTLYPYILFHVLPTKQNPSIGVSRVAPIVSRVGKADIHSTVLSLRVGFLVRVFLNSRRNCLKHSAGRAQEFDIASLRTTSYFIEPAHRFGLQTSFRRVIGRIDQLDFHLDGVLASLNPLLSFFASLAHSVCYSGKYTVTKTARLLSGIQAQTNSTSEPSTNSCRTTIDGCGSLRGRSWSKSAASSPATNCQAATCRSSHRSSACQETRKRPFRTASRILSKSCSTALLYLPSVVIQTDGVLSRTSRARRTLARISSAFAVQVND